MRFIRILDLPERREHFVNVAPGDSDTGIADRDLDIVTDRPGTERNQAFRLGKLDRVGQQVDDYLTQLAGIGLDDPIRDLGIERNRDLYFLFACRRFNQPHGALA